MNIVIIGTGNVAQVLGKMLLAAGHTIVQVYGRNESSAQHCAALLKAQPVTVLPAITKDAAICLLAISDSAVGEVSIQLQLPETIILHTSGGVSINVLSSHRQYGALYPLQSLRKELPYLPQVPFFVDGSNKAVKAAIFSLAQNLSPEVYYAGDEERLKLHLAAVVASNFTNHLYALTQSFCEEENISFNYLLPLIKETALRMDFYNPADLQTGPAVRGDEPTILKHLQLLQGHPALARLYEVVTKSIWQSSKK